MSDYEKKFKLEIVKVLEEHFKLSHEHAVKVCNESFRAAAEHMKSHPITLLIKPNETIH